MALSFVLGPAPAAAQDEQGRVLYLRFCATCHGEAGDGAGPAARFLSARPRDFRRGEYEFRTTQIATLPLVEDLVRTISAGLVGTPMPSWHAVLAPTERQALARYVLSLAPADATPASAALEITPEPSVDAAALERGRKLYAAVQCRQCHGDQGEGDGLVAPFARKSDGTAIRPADLTRGVFKSGRGARAIYRVISTGLSGTPMPSYAGVLNDAERWDLAHYVDSLRQEKSVGQFLFADPAGRQSVP